MPEAVKRVARQPPVIPATPDQSKHLFFVSHATARDNTPFEAFFRDLSYDVEQLMPRWRADMGFIDRGMQPGVDWEREILRSVGTCQVFVALLSAPFISSDYCGKEFDAFSRRRTWRRSDATLMEEPKCILPVIWAPMKHEPAAVSRFQRFSPESHKDPELAQLYQQEGVFGLLQMEGADGAQYHNIVWRIARKIQWLVEEYWVERRVPRDVATLRNVFDEGV